MTPSERFRPQFHFTPEQNWMNDPNGLVYYGGEYHLFYQHNPYDTTWGHMHWGHAASPDLVHWQHLPIALHEELRKGITMFSGSAVVDWHSTGSFGKRGQPAIVVTYTGDHSPIPLEDIHVAYSIDRGRTFTKYEGNPVIDVGSPKFGDPKVFWRQPTNRWIMVNILGHEQGCVVLYSSVDFRHWEVLSRFEAPDVAPNVWECPDLFPMALDGNPKQIKWMLKVNSTGSTAGQRTWYFLGDFDGTTFVSNRRANEAAGRDYGEIYAEATYNDIPALDGRRVLIGWIRQQPIQERPWTGAQSIPRVLTLRSSERGQVLCQTPVKEMKALRQDHYRWDATTITDLSEQPLQRLEGGELEIKAELRPDGAAECGLGLRMSQGGTGRVGYSTADEKLFVEQGKGRRVEAPYALAGGPLRLHVFIDHNLVEVFAGDGETIITTSLEPDPLCESIQLYADGGSAHLLRLDAWRLSSA